MRLSPPPPPRTPRLMLFDLYHQGHHGQHVRVLVDYWTRHDLPGQLDVVVSQEFCARFPDLVEAAAASPRVAVHPVPEPVGLREKVGRRAVLANDRRIGHLLQRAVVEHRPDHCVLLYVDHLQFSLATGLRFDLPVRFSGTYFRPSFYYRQRGAPFALRPALDDLQKRTLLRLALRNPHVDTLFCLDPYAVEPIRRLGAPARIVHLPEPFEADALPTEPREATRRRLGVEDGRHMLLLFGALDPRKGVLELLHALQALPGPLAQRACLVMAGETTTVRQEVEEAVAALRAEGTLQVLHLDAFVPDAEMHRLFGAASLVLLPYQHHVGSSGVVVRAAAAGVPVLGPEYGMLGPLIRDHGLGMSVDTTRPADLVRGLVQFLDEAAPYPFDPSQARAYAAANTEHAMASTLFGHVLGRTLQATRPAPPSTAR